jgi:hypothetical protein
MLDRSRSCVVLLAIAPACSVIVEDEEMLSAVTASAISQNGVSLNGMSLNGMSLNGVSLNGMSLNAMSLNGMSLNGMSLNGMSLNGSELVGFGADGRALGGADLIGTRMEGILSSGDLLVLRIDSAQLLPGPSEVWAYGVSYGLADGTWPSLCGATDGVPVLALALAGVWNGQSGVVGGGAWSESSTSFTFGCRGAALAKCVELGYEPWQSIADVSLHDHHLACVRMIRADYCGDGTAWTTDGIQINLYDDVGIQEDAANWKIDAEWLPSGARCIHKLRDFQRGRPSCWELKKGPCGSFEHGALLIDEYRRHGGN